MSNPIKYSTGSESLALKTGNFYIGTGDVGKGPTSTTGYYNGITPPSGGYTIYLNKATGGPSIYTCANDTELISLTNSIAGTSYTTANECLTYFAGQNDKMVLNRDYEGIVTDGLVLNLDAGFTPSYPENGTTFYDISTNTNNGTLINGPTFNSSDGGSIVFDGTDDYITMSNLTIPSTGPFTIGFFYKITNTGGRGGLFERKAGPPYNGVSLGQGAPNNWGLTINSDSNFNNALRNNVSYPSQNTWYCDFGVFNGSNTSYFYRNGVLINTSVGSTQGNLDTQGSRLNLQIFKRDNDTNELSGNVSVVLVYNRALSSSEILQNFNAQKGRFGL